MFRWNPDRWFTKGRTPARLPDFLCVGAQRSGTTTFHHHLSVIDVVYLPPSKELQYFSLHSQRHTDWYASHFAEASPGQLVGEVTPYYLFHPFAAARIATVIPRAKIVILLRDPVERAVSGYFHSRRLGLESLDIEAAFRAESQRLKGAEETLGRLGTRHNSHQHHSYLSRSRYEMQLPRYFAHFPASQILMMRSEDLFLSPADSWGRIMRFLDLDERPLAAVDARLNMHPGNPLDEADPSLMDFLREELTETYVAMSQRYGIDWGS